MVTGPRGRGCPFGRRSEEKGVERTKKREGTGTTQVWVIKGGEKGEKGVENLGRDQGTFYFRYRTRPKDTGGRPLFETETDTVVSRPIR